MKHLRIENGSGESLEVTLQQDDEFEFQIDNPWAGDSESGFGRTENVRLTRDQAVKLRDFLNKMLD
jgi:hypothetical protein